MNEELAEVEPLGRLLFAGLWCIADRKGRLEDRPKRIKAEVLPYDDCDVDELLNQLAGRGFIVRYEVDGKWYIQVINFTKHQNPHKNEKDSEIPAPEHSDTSTVQAQEMHNTNPADSLNLIPDSLNLIEEGPENPDAPSTPLTKNERECLKVIKEVPNYHFDYAKDIDHLRSLVIDFPKLDILNELKKWRTYKLDHPLKKNSNARLQIRNWLENAERWNKDERASPESPGDNKKFEGIYLT